MPERFLSRNPATGKIIEEFVSQHAETLELRADASFRAFQSWRRVKVGERAQLLLRVATILESRAEQWADLITEEMGKIHKEAVDEVKKCAACCRHYAEHAEKYLRDDVVETAHAFTTYQPIGTILAIMPWNFPFWQVFRCAVPALTAGNAVMLKHAPNVFRCANAIVKIFLEAGYPENLCQSLMITNEVALEFIAHPVVRAVSLTGSVAAGRAVAARAGQCLKKTVLELGGSDPYIVLADADVALAANKCAESRLLNAGQSCIAAKRFLVVSDVYDAFLEKFTDIFVSKITGDPRDPATHLGPLARADLRDNLHQQVSTSIAQGAKCVLGGKMLAGEGFYYTPTILTGVKKGMAAYDEELFGPAAVVFRVADAAEAIATANDTAFGLGAAVFTRNLERGTCILREELDVGNGALNDFVRSDPRLPFGGVKESGYGRELAWHGMHEFVNCKSVTLPERKA